MTERQQVPARRERAIGHRSRSSRGLGPVVTGRCRRTWSRGIRRCPSFAAEARVFDAAERGRGVGDDALVDTDHADLELFADPQRPGQVAGERVGDKPELGVVGAADGLVVGGERRHRCDRSEDLLADQLGRVRYVGEHRGRVEIPPLPHRFTAAHQRRPLADRILHQGGNLLASTVVDQRSDGHSVLGPPPDCHRSHPGREPVGELGGHRLVDEEPVRGGAGLADVAHLGQHRPVHRGVQVGVGEDQERRVAAELHGHPAASSSVAG